MFEFFIFILQSQHIGYMLLSTAPNLGGRDENSVEGETGIIISRYVSGLAV